MAVAGAAFLISIGVAVPRRRILRNADNGSWKVQRVNSKKARRAMPGSSDATADDASELAPRSRWPTRAATRLRVTCSPARPRWPVLAIAAPRTR